MLFPIIKVRDNDTGHEHIVGTDSHDMLFAENGLIAYYNLQNGDGSMYGTYSFLGEDDEVFGVIIEFVTFDELKDIYERETKQAAENKRLLMETINRIKSKVNLKPISIKEEK